MTKRKNKTKTYLKRSEEESLHLSEFSHGKPFEFSLNVLENKLLAQDQKKPSVIKRLFSRDKGSAQGLPDTPYISDGTNALSSFSSSDRASRETSDKSSLAESAAGAATGTAAASSATKSKNQGGFFLDESSRREIVRRQTRRRVSRIISIACVVAIIAAIAVFGGGYLYKEYQKQLSNVELLKTAFGYLEESDKMLVEIDTFFQQKFDDSTVSRAEELLKQIPDAQKKLDSAREQVNIANEGLNTSTKDKEAAEYALNSISARETMLSVSKERLEEDIAAKKAMDAMNQVQEYITEANSLLVQAAKVIANTTAENVNTSTQYTTSAREFLSKAQAQLNEVTKVYPKADLSALNEYVNKRIEAADAALASNAAILLQDKQTAEDNNNRYNEADAASVAMAENLPRSFDQPIIDIYQSSISSLAEKYDSARSDVGRNDSFLREYLGIKTNS